jgi:peroxiredoxin
MLKSNFGEPNRTQFPCHPHFGHPHSLCHPERSEGPLHTTPYGSLVISLLLCFTATIAAQEKTVWSEQEKPIVEQIKGLRKLDDTVRARTTKELALKIRELPVVPNKLQLAGALANLSTEGDFGRDTLQEVTTTLASALREQPPAGKPGQPHDLYVSLASLVRYEHMRAESDNPQFAEALSKLESADAARQKADFTLTDLQGNRWHLQDLKGKVVLVNFWATWCPPCRKEMPDLQALYDKYKEQGFVVLSISDEAGAKVQPFITERKITYPVLLDPGRKVNEEFQVEGIPKSFVYDRQGKLVAQSIDMRTRTQFQEMLAQAGLH